MDRSSFKHESWLLPTLFFLTFLIGTYPTIAGVVERWTKMDESYSHGFLVLAVCLYLTIEKARQVRPKPGFYWIWLFPFIASVAVYAVGDLLLIEAIQQITLLPILFGGLLIQWGWRQTVPFLVPIGLIVFTIPFWDYLAWSLQLITVEVNQFLLARLDINFVVEGVFVYFPGVGAFEIAHGCSGLRYLLVGLTLTFLYGELNFRFLRSRVKLVLFGIALALAANWIRVFVIIYQGYTTHMQSSLVHEHDFFGWWVFAGTLVPVFLFARWLERIENRSGEVAPVRQTMTYSSRSRAVMGGCVAVAPVLLLVGLFLPGSLQSRDNIRSEPVSYDLSFLSSADWLPLFKRELGGWRPIIEHPDRMAEKTFAEREALNAGNDPSVEYFVGLYSYDFQRPRAEVVQYGNRIYDGEHFVPTESFTLKNDGKSLLAGLSVLAHNDKFPIHLAYAYYVEGRWETGDLQAKFAQLPGVFNRRSDASLLVVGIRCTDCDWKSILEEKAPLIRGKTEAYLDSIYLSTE